MKKGRHEKILELIGEREVGTQEELLELLRDEGFDVTQATVSRDIKELRLIKALSKNGEYIYSTGKGDDTVNLSSKFYDLFADSVIKMDYVFNQIVIKCYSGLANAVCASMDQMNFDNLVGTIAGDDTILVVMRTEQSATELFYKLRDRMKYSAQ